MLDCGYHWYRSVLGIRFGIGGCWPSRCPHLLRSCRHRRVLVSVCHRRNDFSRAYLWYIPSLRRPMGRPCTRLCTWVSHIAISVSSHTKLIFEISWNYFYTNAVSVPVEITAATILLTFWDSNVRSQICFPFQSPLTLHAVEAPGRLYGTSLRPSLHDQHLRCTLVWRVRVLLLHHQMYVVRTYTSAPKMFIETIAL